MKILINRQSNVSVREQIYLEIAQRIRSGLLEANFKLPSVRKLSEELGVSLVTAHQVYKLLDANGLTDTMQGKGTFVRGTRIVPAAAALPCSFDWQLSIPDYLPRASFWSQSSVRLPPNILDLASASVHPSLLPTELLKSSIRQALDTYPEALEQYSNFQGDGEFLLTLAQYLRSLSVS